jgi:hypothetical protein
MKNIFVFILVLVPLSIFTQNIDSMFLLNTIDNDFLGTYLPVEYINSLNETKNHSISMHLNRNMYHDVLSVEKNIIYSNARWHDQYAIPSAEGNIYQFIRNGEERIIVDNNGYSYRKIGDNSTSYYNNVRTFTANIVFKEAIEHGIGIKISGRNITIPFLYFFLNEDTFEIILDDMFFEKGANILLYDRGKSLMIYVSLNNFEYTFFEMTQRNIDIRIRAVNPIIKYNTNDDKRILFAMVGIGEETSEKYLQYFDEMDEYDKRIITNAMFALNGYAFRSEQWQTFFNKYFWYKPNNEIRNDVEILNTRQRRLLEYLNN